MTHILPWQSTGIWFPELKLWNSQLSPRSASGDLKPSSDLWGYPPILWIFIHSHTYIHTNNNKNKTQGFCSILWWAASDSRSSLTTRWEALAQRLSWRIFEIWYPVCGLDWQCLHKRLFHEIKANMNKSWICTVWNQESWGQSDSEKQEGCWCGYLQGLESTSVAWLFT